MSSMKTNGFPKFMLASPQQSSSFSVQDVPGPSPHPTISEFPLAEVKEFALDLIEEELLIFTISADVDRAAGLLRRAEEAHREEAEAEILTVEFELFSELNMTRHAAVTSVRERLSETEITSHTLVDRLDEARR